MLWDKAKPSSFQLKGRKYTKAEALSILSRLKIEFKQNARAGTLSGGQKRKLSLAIALIGGSEVCKNFFEDQELQLYFCAVHIL